MILRRLAEHYDRIVLQNGDDLATPGFSRQKISFCIVLNADGTLNQFESLLEQVGKARRAKSLIVPGQGKPSGQGINPCLLWDNAEYLLGYSTDPGRAERAAREFEASRRMYRALQVSISHPSFTAVCRFFDQWCPEKAAEHPELAEIVTNFGVFRLAGETQFVHQQVSPPKQDPAPSDRDSSLSMCLVSGEMESPARLHEPKIKGVAGAQTAGALLVSFNAGAFTSYGKEQSFNAPVGETSVFKYANALNYLLGRSDRRVRLGDATVVYWADHKSPVEDAFAFLFSGEVAEGEKQETQEDPKRIEQARLLLSQLRSGTQSIDIQPDGLETKFFILGLSPNASRIAVRFWVEADASEMLRRLAQHVKDLSLSGGRDDLPPPLWRVVLATGRAEFDQTHRFKSYASDSISPKLAGDLAHSVLTGLNYPQYLLATVVRRVFADGHISFERVSAIKGCLLRNTRRTINPLEIPMELNYDSMDLAYRCGRLFAILEKAQNDSADGELNATIKDRYFSAASVTPALIFPRLFRLNGYHLGKLDRGSKIYYERLIGGVTKAPFQFPRQLPLIDQGKFIIGYFQQRQDLYTSKRDRNSEENA